MARMEMDCILKNRGCFFFKFIAAVLEKSLKLRLWFIFSFKSSLDIFRFVLYKHFMYDIVYLVLIWGSFDQKKIKQKTTVT